MDTKIFFSYVRAHLSISFLHIEKCATIGPQREEVSALPKIDSFRIVNVDFDNKAKKINDLSIELGCKNTNIILGNGSGKTFIISLLFQTINPGVVDAEGRDFQSMLKDLEGTAHIAICHVLDNGKKIVTGFTARKREKIDFFTYVFEMPDLYQLKYLPFVNAENVVTEFNDFKNHLEKNREALNTRIFTEQSKSEYRKFLESYRILKTEWDMMSKTNRIEGGISEFLGSGERKKASDLLSKFIIPNIAYANKQEKDKNELAETFKEQVNNIKNLPKWEAKIEKGKNFLALFEKQISNLKYLFDIQEEIDKHAYILSELHKHLINRAQEAEKTLYTLKETEKLILDLLDELDHKERAVHNSYFLYLYNSFQTELESIAQKISEIQQKIHQAEEKKQLKRVLEYYSEYIGINSQLNTVEEAIHSRMNDQEKITELQTLSSKIFDYYAKRIQETLSSLKEKQNFLSNIEKSIKENTAEQYKISDEIEKRRSDIADLGNKKNSLLKIASFEELKNFRTNFESVEKTIQKITADIQNIKEEQDKKQYRKFEILTRKNVLQQAINEKEAQYISFQNVYQNIKLLLKLYSISRIDVLQAKLEADMKLLTVQQSECEKESATVENTLTTVKENRFLPPPTSIHHIKNHLKSKGMYDFTTGYDLVKTGKSKNPLLFNALVVEDNTLKDFNNKLNGLELNGEIVLLFNREEIENSWIEDNIGISKLKFVLNDYHKIIAGKKSLEEYEKELTQKIDGMQKKVETLKIEHTTVFQYLESVRNFRYSYGNDAEKIYEEMTCNLDSFQKEALLCEQQIRDIEETLLQSESARIPLLEILKEKQVIKSNFEEKRKKFDDIKAMLKDKYLIEFSEIDTLQQKKSVETGEFVKKSARTKTAEQRLETDKRRHQSEMFELNANIREYEIAKNSRQKGEFLYSNESIQHLEARYGLLSSSLDTKELLTEKEKLLADLSRYQKKITREKYSMEDLQRLKDLELFEDSYYDDILKMERESLGVFLQQKGSFDQKKAEITTKIEDFQAVAIEEKEYITMKNAIGEKREIATRELGECQREIKTVTDRLLQQKGEIQSQKQILSQFGEVEKKMLSNFDIFQSPNLHTAFFEIYKRLTDGQGVFVNRKAQITDGWQELKGFLKEEGETIASGMSQMLDKKDFFLDYNASKILFERIQTIIDTEINTLTGYKNNAMRFKDKLIGNIVNEINIYITDLENLSKKSRVKIKDRWINTVDIQVSSIEEKDKYERISQYIDDLVIAIEEMLSEDASHYIEKSFAMVNLLKQVNNAPIKIKVYKPSSTERISLYPWENVDSWSGGEKFFTFFCVYISMILFLRRGLSNSMVILCDNPFGKASSEHILQPLIQLMNENNVQFVTFTAHNDENLSKYFDYNYSVVLVRANNKSILKVQRAEEPYTYEKGYYVEW